MRLMTAVGIGCALCAAPATAQAPARDLLAVHLPTRGVENDTTTRIRFSIPEQPLADALGAFSRQASVRVRADLAAAAGLRSRAVSGSLTAAQALRQLLEGTGMTARFPDGQLVLVRPADAASRAYTLTPLSVVGERSRGYTTRHTTSATRTDTPLRDVPQAVTVVTQDVIADQSMQSMADVVRYIPGVSMGQGEGHRDAPTIRGNATTADFFVDGVRDDVQYLRDVYNLERVEALKGSNAMVFGRGGGGGVLNRVTKEAQWAPVQAVTVEGGSFDHRRATADLGRGFGPALALRVNGMYENSGGFRDEMELRRMGINPTATLALGAHTTVRAGYEFFDDERTVDRGVPSFQGRPSTAGIRTFFGNPDSSYATARVHAAGALVEYVAAEGVTVRNRTRFADYAKFYQNSFPGALNAAGTQVSLGAYSNATDRRNLFNQTDAVVGLSTGPLRHTLLVGAEIGRQRTDNFRQTGYYNDATPALLVAFDAPNVNVPITFRQSASDADNGTTATVGAVYLQDQVELSRHWQLVGGVRLERFEVDFRDNRRDLSLSRTDDLLSPRAGLVFKPTESASLYGSYSVSYLPSSGDQFASLSATSATLEPEEFTNYEVGAKWDVLPSLALTASAYRLDHTNTTAPDPADASRVVQTGAQRTTGLELGATGSVTPWWQVMGGLALQRARIESATTSAREGATVPLVPEQSFSLWNRFQLLPAVGVGLGVVYRSDVYAAIDNTVTLPGYTRADGALFLRLTSLLSAQVNVENLLDERYYATSHGNNNIMPGASRTLRLSLTTRR